MLISDGDWERLALDRLQADQQATQWTDPVEEPDHQSLMATRPIPRPPFTSSSASSPGDSTSSSCSQSTNDDAWKRTVVLNLDGHIGHITSTLLPWNDADELHARIAQAF